jgi:beta-lactamase regulating signal transducer with metallopeptidase domain
MRSLDDLLVALSFAYAAGFVGLAIALLSRAWERRSGGTVHISHASWRVWLPPIALLVLPLSILFPHPGGPLAAAHDWWHALGAQLHSFPKVHAALHAGNYTVLVLGLAGLVRVAYALGRMRSFADTLRLSNPVPTEPCDGVRVSRLPLDEPLCFAAGFPNAIVYVSDGFEAALCPRDRVAVLAHEVAHVRRFHPAALTLLTLFYAAFPLPGARLLLADWHHASERDCDEAAARQLGSPTAVATALVRVAQVLIRKRDPYLSGVAFLSTPDDVTGRVQALLRPSPAADRRTVTLHLATTLTVLLSAGAWVYHAVELFVRH